MPLLYPAMQSAVTAFYFTYDLITVHFPQRCPVRKHKTRSHTKVTHIIYVTLINYQYVKFHNL